MAFAKIFQEQQQVEEEDEEIGDIEHMNSQDCITAYLGSSHSSIAEHFAVINDNNNNIKNESSYLRELIHYYIINVNFRGPFLQSGVEVEERKKTTSSNIGQ